MSVDRFIPSLWAATLLENLNDSHVAVNLCNRNYEGDIDQMGDTVRITSIGRVTIADYVKNTTAITPETLDDSQQVLTIDQAKYFAFEVDDVDARQVRDDGALMDVAMRDAAWGLGDAADVSVLAAMQAQVDTGNALGAMTIGTGNVDAYENLVDLSQKLDENNVPRSGRWCVIPPFYHGWLQKNANFVSYGTQANREDLENGIIGAAAGMRIVVSNNLPSAGAGRNTLSLVILTALLMQSRLTALKDTDLSRLSRTLSRACTCTDTKLRDHTCWLPPTVFQYRKGDRQMAVTAVTLTELTLNEASADLPVAAWTAIATGADGFSLDVTGVGSPVLLGFIDSAGGANNVTITAGDRPPAQVQGQGNLAITMAANDVKYVTVESGRFEQNDSTIKGISAGNNTKMIAFLLPVNWG